MYKFIALSIIVLFAATGLYAKQPTSTDTSTQMRAHQKVKQKDTATAKAGHSSKKSKAKRPPHVKKKPFNVKKPYTKPAQAKRPHYKKQHKSRKKGSAPFSRNEKNAVNNYYKNLPPGLAKKYRRTHKLPPGWEKKVAPGQVLSPQYLKLALPAPEELKKLLKAGPAGYTLLHLNGRILRVHNKTHVVHDSFLLPKIR